MTTAGMWPLNSQGQLPLIGPAPRQNLATGGDNKGNEQPALLAISTLFLREHNRRAAAVAAANPMFSDEEVYQLARRWTIAVYQQIVYLEVRACVVRCAHVHVPVAR